MKVSKETWFERMQNLMNRRKASAPSVAGPPNKLSNYGDHLSKVHVGKSVLDVGCGSMAIKSILSDGIKYYGLDPFPVNSEVIEGMIETRGIEDSLPEIDTVICFAVMDGCMDFSAACENIKKIAKENVVFLTGIGIDPDQYHTHRIELSDYRKAFSGWRESLCDRLADKVYLLEYRNEGS